MIYDLNIEQDKKQAMLKFEAFSDKGVVIELKEKMKNRTLSQNAYLHVLFGLYGCAFGYTLRESKTFLKRECPFMRYKKNTDVFLRSTASLDKIEMIEFIDWIRGMKTQMPARPSQLPSRAGTHARPCPSVRSAFSGPFSARQRLWR